MPTEAIGRSTTIGESSIISIDTTSPPFVNDWWNGTIACKKVLCRGDIAIQSYVKSAAILHRYFSISNSIRGLPLFSTKPEAIYSIRDLEKKKIRAIDCSRPRIFIFGAKRCAALPVIGRNLYVNRVYGPSNEFSSGTLLLALSFSNSWILSILPKWKRNDETIQSI